MHNKLPQAALARTYTWNLLWTFPEAYMWESSSLGEAQEYLWYYRCRVIHIFYAHIVQNKNSKDLNKHRGLK